MKPESKTTIKIGNAVLNAEDLDHEDKAAIIELALHLAAPKIAALLVGSISKEIENEEENKSRETNKHDKLLFEMPEVLTVQEVADYMRVCKSKVYEMCRAYGGELFPNFKVGNRYKIPRNEFIEWLNMGGMHSFDKQIEDLRVKKNKKESPT